MNELPKWLPCLDGPLSPRDLHGELNLDAFIAISTSDFASYEALATALVRSGANCQWLRDSHPIGSATIGIWDGGQLDANEWQRLKNFATKLRRNGGTFVVLLDFPRKEQILRLRALGCEIVFGKPYIVGELVMAIAGLANPEERNSRA
jgi:hypothetical protein